MNHNATVYIVDDDNAIQESLRWLIESEGFRVHTFDSAIAFLSAYKPHPLSCLLLDVRMPKMSGLELQDQLIKQKKTIPIIFITGHGDINMAVRAMKKGAIDFLIKPFSDQDLLDSLHIAANQEQEKYKRQLKISEVKQRIAWLTPRELEVMKSVVAGKPNKVISTEFGIGCKTVEIHRSRVMKKMQAKSLAELVRMIINHDLNSDEKLLITSD